MSKRSQRTKQTRSYPPVKGITPASFGLDSNNQLFQLSGIMGPAVTVRSALSVPAVSNAVQAVSHTLAAIPVNVFRDHAQEPDLGHPVYRLFNTSPNPLQTPMAFRASMVSDMMVYGASVSEIVRNGRGEVTELWRIEPTRLTITPDKGARWVVRVDGQEMDPADLLYCLYHSLDGITPVSPLTLCRDSIALALAVERFGVSFFKNGARPGGMLTVPQGAKPEDKRNAKENWEQAHGGMDNANVVAVMPFGYDYKPFTVAPNESQFNETREATVKQVQRILNVPGWVLKDETTDYYTNRQDAAEDYVRHCLHPIAEIIEQAVEKAFLGDGYECEHDFKELLRGTPKDRAEYVKTLVDGGILTPNEGRDLLGWPAHPDGDDLIVTPAAVAEKTLEQAPADAAKKDQPPAK